MRGLGRRAARRQLADGDWPIVSALVDARVAREEKRQERLARKVAEVMAAEASCHADPGGEVIDVDYRPCGGDAVEGAPALAAGAAATPVAPQGSPETTSDGRLKGKTAPGKGHGRNGASAFTNAKHVLHALLLGVIGALCARCKQANMTSYREKVTVKIVGQPLFGVEVHHFEQARCKMCGHIIRAKAAAGTLDGIGTSYVVYHWTACAMLAVLHYLGGMPFKRLETLHAGWGVPIPDANQWQVVSAGDDLLLLLLGAMEREAMRTASDIRLDDTGTEVIELRRQIKAQLTALRMLGESEDAARTGINATGVRLTMPDGVAILYYSGLHHSGEILDRLWKHRLGIDLKLVKVTDGASKNFDHSHRDMLLEAICNAHAFLKFDAVKDKHPAEYAVAGEVYKQVFDNDDVAKERGMTPEERRDFHAERSRPLLVRLLAMCKAKVDSKLVEPNSPLWEPVSFMVNQWPRLTLFCEVPGVPLDTNLLEQDLITITRYLGASFNYQTTTGSEVGDRYMSLAMSARANGAEPVAYIAYCLEHHEDLKKRPEHYLPWAYAARMREAAKPPDGIQ